PPRAARRMPRMTNAAALPACVLACAWYDGDGCRHDMSLEEVGRRIAGQVPGFAWIGLYEPQQEILDRLQQALGLHPLAEEDAGKAHQRPKVEAYGDTLFVAAHTAQMEGTRIAYGETHAFLGCRFLLTVRHGASLSYAPVRARLEREPELLRAGPAMALYGMLDFIVDNYAPIVDAHRDTLHALERDIFSDTYRRAIVVRLYDLKRELTNMRGTALSVTLSLVSVAPGERVKRLGAWAALLAAPTLVTSWYGMNFAHMPELAPRWAYPALALGVGLVCGVLYRVFRRARWL